MKSAVETLSPTRAKLTVEVPFEELKPSLDAAYKKIAQQINVPGFRRGKVPPMVIDRQVGRGAVLDEAINEAVPKLYVEALQANELEPLAQPEIEITKLEDNETLEFSAEVDVRPEIDLPELSSLAAQVDEAAVTDADVDEALDNLRARFATLTGVERAAAKDDFVQIDLAASVDGEAVEEAQTSGLSYQVGQGGLIDGIDDAITGLSAGESATFPTTLVAGEYKDREAEVTVTVTAVKERELPAADDEFAQLASEFDTLEELTADLRTRLDRVRQMEQLTEARDKVLDALVDATEVPLPEGILKQEIDSRVHDAVHPFDHDEAKFAEFLEENGKTREEFDTEAREDAEKSVRVRLVLDKLADDQEVTVSQDELTERIVFQAQQYQMPPEEFVKRIQEAGQLGAIYADVRRSKALIAAVRAATVTDASGTALEMAELLGDDEPEQADEAPEKSAEKSDEKSAEKSDETTVDA